MVIQIAVGVFIGMWLFKISEAFVHAIYNR